MIALVQRVTGANVNVAGKAVGVIGSGLVALIGVERGDTEVEALLLAERVMNYRMFADAEGRMNLSVKDVRGQILAVPQFTLAADTNSGARPSFSSAATPNEAEKLFKRFVEKVEEWSPRVATGRFGAEMQVSLVNDGPVTFWLQVSPKRKS
ncbi:MAG TPA: D-aminoacyl-tRNA deacylase [Burkholderiales bacterium]|nr:D-aminoacyl-tRNA deacylase [Burkholderiales bacterium]